jgi:hypothetical protein
MDGSLRSLAPLPTRGRPRAQAGWGNCGQAFMTNPTSDSPCGHCMKTCGRCSASA